jgi:hypothetical protein
MTSIRTFLFETLPSLNSTSVKFKRGLGLIALEDWLSLPLPSAALNPAIRVYHALAPWLLGKLWFQAKFF